jgi:hypothetical protein
MSRSPDQDNMTTNNSMFTTNCKHEEARRFKGTDMVVNTSLLFLL